MDNTYINPMEFSDFQKVIDKIKDDPNTEVIVIDTLYSECISKENRGNVNE